MLCLSGLKKIYPPHTVLSLELLSLPPGSYWIQGKNGSGKSTLLKCIAGIVPFQGSIRYSGIDNQRHRVPFSKLLGYGEAEPTFPDRLTAAELIGLVQSAKLCAPAETSLLCQQLGVDAYLEKPVRTCSSGMLKKVSLVMALMGKPRLILLDEPYITLDEPAQKALNEILIRFLEQGATLLFSSHLSPDPLPLPITACYKIAHAKLERI